MAFLRVASGISLLLLMACGQTTKSVQETPNNAQPTNQRQADPEKRPLKAPTIDDSESQGISGQGDDQPFTPVNNQQPIKTVQAPVVPAAPAMDPIKVPAPTAPSTPKKDIPDEDVKINTPSKGDVASPDEVAGLGSDGEDVQNLKQLMSKGYKSAIKQANVCYKTGSFSDHSRCFMVFGDGHKEWVNPDNRDKILPFIEELKSAEADQKGGKKKKKHHRFLFF